jgi:YkoY family integral membrane protein
MYGQTFGQQDLATIALLIVLEGVLSIDNALVLALLAKRLPKSQQARALTYGLVGAFAFRFLAIGGAAYLLRWDIVKLIGGGYLIWVALKHLLSKRTEEHTDIHVDAENNPTLVSESTGGELSPAETEEEVRKRTILPVPLGGHAGFWPTVLVIELTDIAFAIDSILAAIAVVGSAPRGHVGPHPKLWVVMVGGMLGVVLMRVAATMFIRLLERFPRFETSAYLLVFVIGAKLLVDWGANSAEHPHRVNFHDTTSPAFWTFWIIMLLCIGFGFLPSKDKKGVAERH